MLTTDRLILRAPKADDTAALHAVNHLNWPRVGNRLRTPDEHRAMIDEQAAKAPGTPGWHQFVADRADTGAVIGGVAVNIGGPGERQAEIGYSFHPDSCGHRYGPEAVARVLTHLFDDQQLHRVIAITSVDNRPSRRLLERLGFRLEAETVESFYHHAEGHFVDEVSFAMLARDWAQR